MTKQKLQKLWNDLTESCSPNILLDILQGQPSNAQVLIVRLNSLREAENFLLSLVEDLTILGQGKKESLIHSSFGFKYLSCQQLRNFFGEH